MGQKNIRLITLLQRSKNRKSYIWLGEEIVSCLRNADVTYRNIKSRLSALQSDIFWWKILWTAEIFKFKLDWIKQIRSNLHSRQLRYWKQPVRQTAIKFRSRSSTPPLLPLSPLHLENLSKSLKSLQFTFQGENFIIHSKNKHFVSLHLVSC